MKEDILIDLEFQLNSIYRKKRRPIVVTLIRQNIQDKMRPNKGAGCLFSVGYVHIQGRQHWKMKSQSF